VPKFYNYVVYCLVLICISSPSPSKPFKFPTKADDAAETFFKADHLRHERELGLVIASGSVEMIKGKRILRADTVSYDQKQDIVTATGNVVLMDADGNISFADYAELTDDLKNGIVKNLRILMSDQSRLAAVSGRRIKGKKLELRKAVYSPCRGCNSNPKVPLWQIKAFDVVHNKSKQNIEYRNAFMEFFGVPVIYTPYFSHPDPTVKRRSGFLVPKYSSNNILGFRIETPYYINITPDKDATLQPIFTTKEGIILAGEYRQRFRNGELLLRGSGTEGTKASNEQGFRGHLFSDIRANLDKTWRAGANLKYTSDDTYLQRYDFMPLDTLKNHVFVEGFRGQNYASAEGYFWRGLRDTDAPAKMPLIMPMLDANWITPVGSGNALWKLDANMLSLTRGEGVDSRRFSLKNSLELPYIAPAGDVYHLYASLQTDVYHNNNYQNSSVFAGRIFPRIGVDWRLPLSRQTKFGTQVVEPVIGLQLAPNGGNSEKISNEDSQDIEFDETNLFSRSRFTGIDRVDGGQRLYYGLRLGNINSNGYSDGFIGQSYRIKRNDDFAANSGLSDNFSDIVGKLTLQPSDRLKLQYRFRLDKDNFSARRNELTARAGPSNLNFNLNYSFFDEGSGSGEFTDREELSYGFSSKLFKQWSLHAATTRDLQLGSTLNQGVGITYHCDCFTMNVNLTRTFTQDRDVKPTDTIFLQMTFKNLGTIYTGTSAIN